MIVVGLKMVDVCLMQRTADTGCGTRLAGSSTPQQYMIIQSPGQYIFCQSMIYDGEVVYDFNMR